MQIRAMIWKKRNHQQENQPKQKEKLPGW